MNKTIRIVYPGVQYHLNKLFRMILILFACLFDSTVSRTFCINLRGLKLRLLLLIFVSVKSSTFPHPQYETNTLEVTESYNLSFRKTFVNKSKRFNSDKYLCNPQQDSFLLTNINLCVAFTSFGLTRGVTI